jgi:uroporphyrinogen decarboxylase
VQRGEHFERQLPAKAYAHVVEAIQQLKKRLTIPLLGFAGAPFTVASYLIEGGSSRDLHKTKKWLYQDPLSFEHLLDQVADATVEYLECQIQAGVDAIQLFDSWAHHLDTPSFLRFSLRYMEKIMKKIPAIPVILFCRGSCFFADHLASIGPTAISLDWSGQIGKVRANIPPPIALQGNLDPMVLHGTKERIRAEADRLLDEMEGDPGYIFNLGHGVLPDIPFENVKCLVDHVRSR